jgi:hypothetical protein
MTKEQFAESMPEKLGWPNDGTAECNDIKRAAIAGWEAHEAQCPTDAVAFAEWIAENGYTRHPQGNWRKNNENYGKWYSTAELYKLFNPSGAAPQPEGWATIDKAMDNIIKDSESLQTDSPETGFGLSKDDLQKLLSHCLKPEEISGAPAVQQARIKELIHWFRRFADGNANAKWFRSHAFELAYYIATAAGNRFIDLDAIRKKAWIEGLNVSPAERDLAQRMGLITIPANPQAAGPVWVKGSERLANELSNKHYRFSDTKLPIPHRGVRSSESWGNTWLIFRCGLYDQKSYTVENVEWLDEAPPSFTPSQIENAFYAACNGINRYLGDSAVPIEEIKKLHKEYMELNYSFK